MAREQIPQISGNALPGGEYRITAEENRRLCETVHAVPAADGSAHPIYAYIAAQSGMGLSIEELPTLCEFDVADGPLFSNCHTRHLSALRTEETYFIGAEILTLTRKPSRKLGVIDVLEFHLTMSDATGERVAEVTNTWILPRRHLCA
jgi:hypothetical protein